MNIKRTVTKDELNLIIMEHIGFYVDEEGNVCDEDTEHKVIVRGKALVDKPDYAINYRYETKFDPIGNPSLMDKLFKFFLDKESEESGIAVKMVSYGPSKKGSRSYLEIVKEDDTKYNSGYYYNDCIKFASIILQLNSDVEDYNLTPLDDELYKQLLKEESRRIRKG